MNRRSILSISAMTTLALALLPTSSIAQQKSLKDQLVGIWTAVSAESTGPNGAKQQFYGAPAKGILILDAGGISRASSSGASKLAVMLGGGPGRKRA
jgi:hypothetical protein